MKTVIIDNERDPREALKAMIAYFCPELEVIAEADGVESGLALLEKTQPDLLFLDVEMDDGTGIDLLRRLGKVDFHVVFYTAFDKYAIDAIRLSAVDYLLKPVDGPDLQNAIARIRELEQPADLKTSIESLTYNYGEREKNDKKLILKDKENIYILNIPDIIRLEGEGSYSTFYTQNGEQYVVSKNLKTYEKLLLEKGFFRSHTSHLINLEFVRKISRKEGDLIVMTDNSQVPLARRRKEELFRLLG